MPKKAMPKGKPKKGAKSPYPFPAKPAKKAAKKKAK